MRDRKIFIQTSKSSFVLKYAIKITVAIERQYYNIKLITYIFYGSIYICNFSIVLNAFDSA